jgi:hypothetical protein
MLHLYEMPAGDGYIHFLPNCASLRDAGFHVHQRTCLKKISFRWRKLYLVATKGAQWRSAAFPP